MPFSFLRKKRVFALLLITFIMLLYLNNHSLGRWIYPIKYEDEIRSAAGTHGVDPLLISAIIRVESNFRADKVSKKGAVGLMQIMPETARWAAGEAGYALHSEQRLPEPAVNIKIGTWYVGLLHRQYERQLANFPSTKDRLALLAAAYNAGPGNVNKWLDNQTWDGSFSQVHMIPFGETRHFIQRIVYYYLKYERYYSDIWYNNKS